MQRNRLRNETDVHNSFFRSMELVKTRNRMESERLKALVDSHIEKHRQYELRTMQRAEDTMRRRLEANEQRRRELGQRAQQDRAEEERLRRFREAARARQSFIDFLIEHVRNKEIRSPPPDEDADEEVDDDDDEDDALANGEGKSKAKLKDEAEELNKTRQEFAKRMAALTANHPNALMRQTVAMFGAPVKARPLRSQIGSFSLKRIETRRHETDRKNSVLESSEEAYKVVRIINSPQELQRQLAEAGKAGYLRLGGAAQPAVIEEQSEAFLSGLPSRAESPVRD